jgi:catechol 2,3-dioxygenase-like lactoylglutathione lyase family enzyme
VPYVNHLTLPVADAKKAAAFYEDWFEARVVPSPKFPVSVAWVLLGRTQVHLVCRGDATDAYHFGLAIETAERFEALYRRADREGFFDRTTFGHHIFEATGGAVQLYLNDPDGNLLECNFADVNGLASEILPEVRRWGGDIEQSEWNRSASLYMPEQEGLAL